MDDPCRKTANFQWPPIQLVMTQKQIVTTLGIIILLSLKKPSTDVSLATTLHVPKMMMIATKMP